MFRADIEIKGKHASYIKQLKDDHKIFSRNIDILMTAPLIGYISGEKEDIDISGEYQEISSNIGTQALLKEEKQLLTIYRLIMLLDDSDGSSAEERIERAFRDDSNKKSPERHKENMEKFFSYVRGGISVLYRKIIEDASIEDDYLKNLYDYLWEFQNDIIYSSIDSSEINQEKFDKIID